MLWIWILSIFGAVIFADQKKLGVGLWFFLSLFLGPLAFIIVLLLPAKTSKPSDSSYREGISLQEARRQLREIQQTQHTQAERIKHLENIINTLSAGEALPLMKEQVKMETAKSEAAIMAESSAEIPMNKSSMELDFGRNWLNKIGVAVLALGIAFLISYSFKYFGPFLKIAFGYTVALVLFLVGIKLESKEKYITYGRGLLGGSWAIIYFTTYAMHHFDASRIITNQMVDLMLLACVVMGMMMHTLKYKSEGMMSITLLVAYLTSTIGQITTFTVFSNLLLGILVLFLVYRFQWIKTFVLSIVLTYGIHYVWVMPRLHASIGADQPWLNLVFLTSYVLLFFVGIHIAKTNKDQADDMLAATNFGNVALYGLLAYPIITDLFYAQRFYLVLGAGILYLITAIWVKTTSRQKLFVSDMTAALFAITFSFTIKFLPTASLLLWLVEAPFLLLIGLKFKDKIYRYFSYALTVYIGLRIIFLHLQGMSPVPFLGSLWSWGEFICFCATISMGVCAYVTQRTKNNSDLNPIDRWFDRVFSAGTCIYFTFWLGSFVKHPWASLSLCVEGIALLILSVLTGLRRFRKYTYFVLAIAVVLFMVKTIYDPSSFVKWLIVAGHSILLFTIYYAMKYLKATKRMELFFENEESLAFGVAFIVLMFSIFQYINPQWISLSLGLASVALLILGVMNKAKMERIGGLALLAITLGRVVFVDISGLDIILKIITFIVLGVLFLGASFIYNKFSLDKDK